MGALSSILDKKPIREKSASKRYLKTISQSSISLNSLDSNDGVEVRKESRPQAMEMSADSIVSWCAGVVHKVRQLFLVLFEFVNLSLRSLI